MCVILAFEAHGLDYYDFFYEIYVNWALEAQGFDY